MAETSEFNQNAFCISRLHEDWLECKKYRQEGNLKKYHDKLQSIELELHCDAKKDYNAENKDYLERINKIILISLFKKKYGLLFANLIEKEKTLKEIENNAGKGTIYRDLEEDDWD